MKKSRLKLFILSALLTATVISILPAPHDAKAAGGPQIDTISTPAGSTLADRWSGVVDIKFDQPVKPSGVNDAGSQIILYWKYINPSTSVVEDKAIWSDYSDGSGMGNVSISSDGLTVTLDMGQNSLTYIEGDKYNIYGNDYKFKYWVRLPAGAFVSRTDPSVNAEGWADESYTVYVQSLPPQVESASPASGASHVIATSGTEFSITFDQNVFKSSGNPVIYQYVSGVSSWADAPKWVCSVSNTSANVLTFKLPEALPNNKTFGIMIPGPANKTGSGSDFLTNSISTPFPGIDMPDTYEELPHAGCWSFTTALSYTAPAMSSHTPAAGALHVGPHTELTMTFDQPVRSVTSSEKNVYIRKYSDGSEVCKIPNTAILAEGSYATTLTIPDQSLSKNTEYYVTIDPGAFENSDGTNYAGISDNSWYFTTIETYEVNFYSDGVQFGETQIVDYGGSAVSPGTPTKTGFIFDRWDKPLTNVTGNLAINAVFKELFTLTYSAGDNGKIEGVTPQTVPYGDSGTQVTAVPDTGYHFVKWSDGKIDASRTDTNVTEDINVTAEFALNPSGPFTLKYAAGEHGSVTGELDQTVEYGGSGTQVKAVPNSHYHFEEWSDGVITADRIDKNVVKNISVTAKFAINKYKVTFKDYDGTVLKTQNVAYGADATPPEDPEREGYTFMGWDGDYEDIRETTILEAEYDKSMYKVSFADYDGTVLKTQSVIHGAGATPPEDPKREGYAFAGWDGDYTKITETVTLTAQYKPNIIKVTFADFDGSVINKQDVEYGKNASAPADPVRKGFIFTGWDKDFTAVTADITVTAQYKAALVVTRAGIQNGNPAVVLKAGGLDIKEASVEGGKVIINTDGTITLEFLSGVKAGDVEVTLKLADGTTLKETVTITDEAVAAMAVDKAGPPIWLWVTIGALVVASAALTVVVRRFRRTR